MELKQVVENIVNDVAVDLTQEFDRNFERKAFFNKKWEDTNQPNSRGSLMLRSGKLRRSINSKRSGGSISWRSSLPYAAIHNEGGEIMVTQKMKGYFWAMYYKSTGGIQKLKSGKTSNSKRNVKLKGEAAKWKAMALMKVGTVLDIKQRQFIGWHPEVDKRIEKILNFNMEEFNTELVKKLKQ